MHTFSYKFGNLLLIDEQRADLGQALTEPVVESLRADVRDALQRGPFTIVREKRLGPSGDPHDYCSIAPYFWPDPTKADGLPWVMRDGEINPERHEGDNGPLFDWCYTTWLLALGARFLPRDDVLRAQALQHLVVLLRTWCVDATTRMNPHLSYTQYVPGIADGNCWGLIDTNLVPGVLDQIQAVAEDIDAIDSSLLPDVRQWFSALADWFLTSDLGKEEAAMFNNHASWYVAQVASFLCFAHRHEEAASIIQERTATLAMQQIDADGKQPHELGRTLSFSYSTYNIMAFTVIESLAHQLSISTGALPHVRAACRFLLPFAVENAEWPYPQIKPWQPERLLLLFGRLGRWTNDPDLLAAEAELAQRHNWAARYNAVLS